MKKLVTLAVVLSMVLSCATFARAEEKPFVHPGVLNTAADLARIAEAVSRGDEFYLSASEPLKNSEFSQPGQTARAVETIVRGGNGQNFALLYTDIAKAYQCALRYHIEGNEECGKTACDILNAWSATLKTVTGNADRYLAAGLYGYQLAAASELMRDYEGFELERMQDVLINVFYKPLCERFLISNEFGRDHNDACITNYWANWDLANMAATVAIGIFCDRRDIYDIGIEYFKNGRGNGSIYNAIPHLFDGSLAQWQESGRDQGHVNLGVGLMACVCEMAYNQGDDLYGWANNRFMYAAEYVARYNNGQDVPFALYEWGTGQKGEYASNSVVSNAGRGEMRPIWAMIYNHYGNRCGFDVPAIKERAALHAPEGGAGGHATSFDQIGFGTLLYTDSPVNPDAALPMGNVKAGVYKIKNVNSGKYISLDGAAVSQNSTGTNFSIADLTGGQYVIYDEKTGLVLEIKDGSHDPLAALTAGEYTNSNHQKFAFIPANDGAFRITAAHASLALDVLDSSKDDGASIIQYRYLTVSNQMWLLEKVEEKAVAVPENTAKDKVFVALDGVLLKTDVAPVIINDRTMMPLRAIFESLGADVTWYNDTRTVIGVKGETTVTLVIDSGMAKINGEEIALDSPAVIVSGRTMVPLRFVSEALGAYVRWNKDTRTAEIFSHD